MATYIEKQRPKLNTYEAAQWRYGQTDLSELGAVARKADSEAEIAVIAQWKALVVRYYRWPDDRPKELDYEIVEDGGWLVYSQGYDLLWASAAGEFLKDVEASS